MIFKVSLFAVGALALAVHAAPARAEFVDGNQLYRWCTTAESDGIRHFQSQASCISFITGAADTIRSADRWAEWKGRPKLAIACLPANVEVGQIEDVVVAYLRNNPADRHHPAAAVAIEAMNSAYPCPGLTKDR